MSGKNKFLSFFLICFLFQSYLFAAYQFDGTNQYLSAAIDQNTFDDLVSGDVHEFSCNFWMFTDADTAVTGTPMSFGNSASTFQFIYIDHYLTDGKIRFWNRLGGGTRTSSTNAISLGAWHNVSLNMYYSIDTLYCDVYVDDNLEIATTGGTCDLSLVNAFSPGVRGDSTPDQYYDGAVAEFAVWNRKLTSGEITGLAGGNAASFYTTDLVYYFSMTSDLDADVGGISFTAYNSPSTVSGPSITYPSAGAYANLIGGNFGNKLINGGLIK